MASEVAAQAFAEKFGTVSFSSFTAFEDALNQYMKDNYVVFLSKYLYDRLPVSRRLTEDELGTCRALLKYGTPSCEVRQFVADEFGKILATQDIYNYRREVSTGSVGQRKVTLVTCFSRWQQKALFRHFSDVVNVDGTHATNRFGFRQDLQLLHRTDPRLVSYLTARWLYITRERAVHAHSEMVHFGNVTNNRLENANGRLKDRVHHANTLEHAIQKASRHAEWLMREIEMHTSYHCDRRQILEGNGYVLYVVCRMTTYACSLVLRYLGQRPPRLPYGSFGTNKVVNSQVNALQEEVYACPGRTLVSMCNAEYEAPTRLSSLTRWPSKAVTPITVLDVAYRGYLYQLREGFLRHVLFCVTDVLLPCLNDGNEPPCALSGPKNALNPCRSQFVTIPWRILTTITTLNDSPKMFLYGAVHGRKYGVAMTAPIPSLMDCP
ncbi:hypothetical protein CLF_111829 [Clonorchis sinensis]|uniref:Uncharacterized protein n=1 Tax=Clonorchis sinensis TaxID=79923 RepID=G7YVD9_CLOSI|nr:hypothetical protein CLF_111829 [Clonorchis sinensis]